jgi:hypothetical protein
MFGKILPGHLITVIDYYPTQPLLLQYALCAVLAELDIVAGTTERVCLNDNLNYIEEQVKRLIKLV